MLIQMNDLKASEHFDWDEIVCKDGHNSLEFPPRAQRHLHMMEELRCFIGIIFIVSSWFRTEAHNKSVGGENGSLHTKGCATDITFGSAVLKNPALIAAMRLFWEYQNNVNECIGAMIVYPWGIHFDSNDDPDHQAALRQGKFYFKTVA